MTELERLYPEAYAAMGERLTVVLCQRRSWLIAERNPLLNTSIDPSYVMTPAFRGARR